MSGLIDSIKRKLLNKWLDEQISEFFEKQVSGSEWVQTDPNIHPSSSVHSCPRYIAFGMLGYRGKLEQKTRRIMDNGTYMHLRWTEYFRNLPCFVDADVPIRGEGVKGTCDIVVRDPLDQQLIVGELKSISQIGFGNIPSPNDEEKNLEWLSRHHPVYTAQILLYMRYLDYEGASDIQKGFFLFENKNDQQFKILWVKRNDALLNELLINARIAQTSILAGVLPDPPFDRTEKICKTCTRKSICFALQDSDRKTTTIIKKRLDDVR